MQSQRGGHEMRHLAHIVLVTSMAVGGLSGSQGPVSASWLPSPVQAATTRTPGSVLGSGLYGDWTGRSDATLRADLRDLVRQAQAGPELIGDPFTTPGTATTPGMPSTPGTASTPETAAWHIFAQAQDVAGLGPSPQARAALRFALGQLGRPYEWGAQGPDSYDCSGLTQQAFASTGILIPRVAADQARVGQAVRLAELLPGDLVFYAYDSSDPATIHHVAMYVGGGLVIHAPQTGDVVRITPLWLDGYIGAVRLSPATRGTGITTVGPFAVQPPPADGSAVDPLTIPPVRNDPGGGVVVGQPPAVATPGGRATPDAGLSPAPTPTDSAIAVGPSPAGTVEPTPTSGAVAQPDPTPDPTPTATVTPSASSAPQPTTSAPAAAGQPAASPAGAQSPSGASSPAATSPAASSQPPTAAPVTSPPPTAASVAAQPPAAAPARPAATATATQPPPVTPSSSTPSSSTTTPVQTVGD
ncbi:MULTISPECIES: C40 family peptidase [unclassified Frankia]|uniref:C40 family peptidase n=1 Tax=unclassified Frankia TaxID=2632575 RepID=UPI002AD385DE|nr:MULTISPECIES: NlpC/P60 family protein [unclassified Frankia]